MALAERRFRPEFEVAFDAWRATNPETNPNAPRGPTYMPQYHRPELREAAALDTQADAAFEAGSSDGERSDKYITFHALRRTYAALRAELGEHPAVTAAQMGHRDPRMTLRVYTDVTGQRPRTRMAGVLGAGEWAPMGTNRVKPDAEPGGQLSLDQLETAAVAGGTGDGSDGTRTRGLRRDRPVRRRRRLTTGDDARPVSPLPMRDRGRPDRMDKRSRSAPDRRRSGVVVASSIQPCPAAALASSRALIESSESRARWP